MHISGMSVDGASHHHLRLVCKWSFSPPRFCSFHAKRLPPSSCAPFLGVAAPHVCGLTCRPRVCSIHSQAIHHRARKFHLLRDDPTSIICSKEDAPNTYKKEAFSDLESEILEFMETTDRPNLFPSRTDLLNAGRADLVDAILAKGGWMVAGWDLESSTEEELDSTKVGGLVAEVEENTRELEIAGYHDATELSAHSNLGSQDCQSVHAIPTVDRQRGWEKVADLFGLSHSTKPEHDGRKEFPETQEIPSADSNEMSKMYGGSQSARHLHDAEINKVLSQPAAAVQDVKTVQTTRLGKKKKRRKTSWSESATRLGNARNKKALRKNDCFSETRSFGTESVEHDSVNPAVSSRIRGLEADLTSTLKSMKKIRHALARDPEPDQKRKAALSELEEVSDALEFCETEIMNKKRELRTARAQVTAAEGKLAVELMEFSRSIDEKERRLEQALNVLKLLRTVRIVWPNPATEVFLAGSFDGWTSWRRMDKSSAGVFVTALQLYPGQYEIKFIVDGDWRVDPNRPITRASGFENNVITVV